MMAPAGRLGDRLERVQVETGAGTDIAPRASFGYAALDWSPSGKWLLYGVVPGDDENHCLGGRSGSRKEMAGAHTRSCAYAPDAIESCFARPGAKGLPGSTRDSRAAQTS